MSSAKTAPRGQSVAELDQGHEEQAERGRARGGGEEGAVTVLISVKMNVVLSCKPFKGGSGDPRPTKTNLMNQM